MGNESEEGEETRRAMSRRKLLGLAAVAAAGLALTPLTEKAQAASGVPLLIGEHNVADLGAITRLDAWVDGGVPHNEVGGLSVQNYGDISAGGDLPHAIVGNCPKGIGVWAESTSGHGVFARSIESAAIKAHSDHGTGVLGVGGDGESKTATGVWGYSKEGIGVHAVSETGTALKVDGKSDFNGEGSLIATVDGKVGFDLERSGFRVRNDGIRDPTGNGGWPSAIVGHCPDGIGVRGESDSGHGVFAYCANGDAMKAVSEKGIGVRAVSPEGTALKVHGKSSFSTVGSGTIPAFKKSYTVNSPGGPVTDKSHISVTLTSDPNLIGEDAAVSFVNRDPANNRFTINLTKAVGRDTTFTYFIVEPTLEP